MCGRFAQFTNIHIIKAKYNIDEIQMEFESTYNIAPGSFIPVIVQRNKKNRKLTKMVWGLHPSWKNDSKNKYDLINIRAETLVQKDTFQKNFQKRRCLIVADGFYEWDTKSKVPYYIYYRNKNPMVLAGIWEDKDQEEDETCSIITTRANKKISEIHGRMPVIVPEKYVGYWLDVEVFNREKLKKLFYPINSDLIRYDRVSRLVNNPKNDSPQCIEPV
ncbi:MAG: SOS response-associated peptidase [Candidatus Mcinerneyibacterium aminivorans]|uniref:Abasic site processing protein n=1 Tax=Candidatus Mcinerneyibacterium aminivorans TaxID=2703815 RepID=A0A5D0MJV3_9BACT|nr:MAG: SOS response-associated peptidase [Candidatus Mcinerneyibacterium aminivorans]